MSENNQMMEVESDSCVDTFPLHYDCAFELFRRVGFEECMNLAEAYKELLPIAKLMYKRKFNKLSFDFQQPIDRILRFAGSTAKSLILALNEAEYTILDLIKIRRTCKQLRSLTLSGFDRKKFRYNPFVNFGNGQLEELTLNGCSMATDVQFFDGYKTLKCFNMFNCSEMHVAAIDRCFKNNPAINSFTCNDQYFQFPQMLLVLRNLERLSLRYYSPHMALDMLSALPLLRHLTLICGGDNINEVLVDLGKSNRLEELVLVDVNINERTIPLIKSLENLKLLAVTSSDACLFPAYKDLPINLTTLKLERFRFANDNIGSVVERLPHLGDMLLKGCELLRNDFWVSDFDWMADLLVKDLTGKRAHRSLNVAIEAEYDQSPKSIPQFLPVMRGTLSLPANRDPEVLERLQPVHLTNICNRMQSHLNACSSKIASDQAVITAKIKEVDGETAKVLALMVEKQKYYSSCAEQFSKVRQISQQLSRCNTLLNQNIESMDMLNNMLSIDERLEPFVWKTTK